MSCLVKDLKGWIKKGKGKMSVDEINENPTYFKIMTNEITKKNPRIHCQVYSDKDKDRVSENYIVNKNTPPKQVLEILSTWIPIRQPEKPINISFDLLVDLKELIQNIEKLKFKMMVSWVATGSQRFHCQVYSDKDKSKKYIANEDTPKKQVLEILSIWIPLCLTEKTN